MLTLDWGEGVVCCIEAEHRGLDSVHLGSWTRCLVVGNTVFIAKDDRGVALVKLADCAGLQWKRLDKLSNRGWEGNG